MKIEFGLEDLAKYPFLNEVKEYIKNWNLDLKELSQEEYHPALQRAKERVREAIQKNTISTQIPNPNIEILSFPLALMIVKALNIDYFTHKYSYLEAKRAEKFLQNEEKTIIEYIFKNVFNFDIINLNEKYPFDFKIYFVDYLKRATYFHEIEWKLINRILDNGFVYLKIHELIKLIREEIKYLIYNRLLNIPESYLFNNIKEASKEFLKMLPTQRNNKIYKAKSDKMPNCIIFLLDSLKKGENISHYSRFFLTTYLLHIGKSIDEIINIYPRSPDFNERLTRYQVEHIAGIRGGQRRYKVPSCRMIAAHGLCKKDKLHCEKIKNPLRFSE